MFLGTSEHFFSSVSQRYHNDRLATTLPKLHCRYSSEALADCGTLRLPLTGAITAGATPDQPLGRDLPPYSDQPPDISGRDTSELYHFFKVAAKEPPSAADRVCA